MLSVTQKCDLKVKVNGEISKFTVDVANKPHQSLIVGKGIGYKFKLSEIIPSIKDSKIEYEILQILPFGTMQEETKKDKVNIATSVDEKEEILKFLEERNVKNLIHFTHTNNLKSILENGICSIKQCERENINYFASDNKRLDGFIDYVSLSIEFPNYEMFYKKRKSYGEDYAVIVIDTSVLSLYTQDEMKFSTSNAAASKTKISSNLANLKKMFENEKLRNKLLLPENYTTDPQAEILIKDKIPPEYIKKVYINDLNNYYDAKKFIIEDGLCFDSRYFSPRLDYEHWKEKEKYNGIPTDFYF